MSLKLDGGGVADAARPPFLAKEKALSGAVVVLGVLLADALLIGVDGTCVCAVGGGEGKGDAQLDVSTDACGRAAAVCAAAAIAAGERYVKVFCLVAGVLLRPLAVEGVLREEYLLDPGVLGVDEIALSH